MFIKVPWKAYMAVQVSHTEWVHVETALIFITPCCPAIATAGQHFRRTICGDIKVMNAIINMMKKI